MALFGYLNGNMCWQHFVRGMGFDGFCFLIFFLSLSLSFSLPQSHSLSLSLSLSLTLSLSHSLSLYLILHSLSHIGSHDSLLKGLH